VTVSVVMPWRGGDPARERAFLFTLPYWTEAFGQVTIGDNDGPFSQAAARNQGVRRTEGDVILIVDADSFTAVGNAAQAVQLAGESDGLVFASDRDLFLAKTATEYFYDGRLDILGDLTRTGRVERLGVYSLEMEAWGGPGGVIAFSRATFDAVGGYDEAFQGWGGEDTGFWNACQTLVAPERRLPGDRIHLWHPRDPDSYPPAATPNFERAERYKQACGNPEAIRALRGEV
jgi:hypothetical protein